MDGLGSLKGFTDSASASSHNIALYIIGAILALGLVGVVWAIANNNSKAKEYTIAWFVAVFFTILFIII